MRYLSYPRELAKHQVLYIKSEGEDEFHINYSADDSWNNKALPIIEGRFDGRISFWKDHGIFFDNCFKNQFIYEFHLEVPDYYYEKRSAITKKYKEKKGKDGYWIYKATEQELSKYWNKGQHLRNQVLYKYLHDNLNAGEFVEIYESWIEEGDGESWFFGPPTSETTITLKELLRLPYPKKTLEFGEREKLTIHRP